MLVDFSSPSPTIANTPSGWNSSAFGSTFASWPASARSVACWTYCSAGISVSPLT